MGAWRTIVHEHNAHSGAMLAEDKLWPACTHMTASRQ